MVSVVTQGCSEWRRSLPLHNATTAACTTPAVQVTHLEHCLRQLGHEALAGQANRAELIPAQENTAQILEPAETRQQIACAAGHGRAAAKHQAGKVCGFGSAVHCCPAKQPCALQVLSDTTALDMQGST